MAKLYNLARVTTSTTGTGTITLGSAVSGFLSFADAGVQDQDVVSYAIKDGTGSEIGTGTYSSSGPTLTRNVINSTNSDQPINLSGSAEVFITPNAEDFYNVDTLDAITDPASDDTVPIYDTSASAHKKITAANFLKVITALTEETDPADDDELLIYDDDGASAKKVKTSTLLGTPLAGKQDDLGLTGVADGDVFRAGVDNEKALTTKAAYDASAEVQLEYADPLVINFSLGTNFKVVLEGSPEIQATGLDNVDGKMGRIRFIQDANGAHEPTWESNVFVFSGGEPPVFSADPEAEDRAYYDICDGKVCIAFVEDVK